MYLPEVHDERTTLVNYLDVQLAALRAAAYGLSDEEARRAPFRSVLSIAGLLKHINFCMNGSLVGAGLHEATDDTHDQPGSFFLAEDESLDSVMPQFDELRGEYLEMCRNGDLDAVLPVGPMPWFGMDEPRPAALRYLYVHHVEEFARHAGHADLIREEIDGAKSAEPLAAIEGRPANDYVTPWAPNA